MARLVVAGTDPEARRLAVAVRAHPGATLIGCAAATIGDAEERAAEWAVTPASPTRLPRKTQGVLISSEVPERLEWARRWASEGIAVLVGSPVGATLDEIDATIEVADRVGVLVGVAEPTLFAPPLVEAMRRLPDLGPLTHLEVRASVAGAVEAELSEDPFDALRAEADFRRAGAAAMALATSLGGPERMRLQITVDTDHHWSASLARDGVPVGALSIERDPRSIPSLSAQVASATHAMRIDLWPVSDLEINGDIAIAPHGLDPTDPVAQLRLSGYRAMVEGFAGVLDRRGGGVCPLGFGRRVVELAQG